MTNRQRDKLMEVDMWDQSMVAIGRFGKLMRALSR